MMRGLAISTRRYTIFRMNYTIFRMNYTIFRMDRGQPSCIPWREEAVSFADLVLDWIGTALVLNPSQICALRPRTRLFRFPQAVLAHA